MIREGIIMAEVTAFDFRSKLSEMLNRVAYGREEITITRFGKTVAVVSPPRDAPADEEGSDQ